MHPTTATSAVTDSSGGGSADTVAALLTLCRNGPAAGAKAAPRAILAIEGRSLGTQHLTTLVMELISRLGKMGASRDSQLPATLAALSSIGRLLPEAGSWLWPPV